MLRKKVKFPITLEEISKDQHLFDSPAQNKDKESDQGSSNDEKEEKKKEETDSAKAKLESKEALEQLCFTLK